MNNETVPPTNVTTSAAVLGQTLAALRKERGLKQGDIAAVIGVSTSHWSRIEKGESSISVDQLRQVAGVLETNPETILGAALAGEKEANSRGVTVVVGTLAGSALASSLVAGTGRGLVAGFAAGSAVGSVIPVFGTVLGGLIGSAVAAYFARKRKDEK